MPYRNQTILLPTKHSKSMALAQPFERILGANLIEHPFDTDQFGTFSGEIERKGTALETARLKCCAALQDTGSHFAVASEGSFGSHPDAPFMPYNLEILYFIDRKRGFELYETLGTTQTNFQAAEIDSLDSLKEFASEAEFPSHALILRDTVGSRPPIKGIRTEEELMSAFLSLKSGSSTVKAETDMRAHCNPTRMQMIHELGRRLASRLLAHCPKCRTPGFGQVAVARGLPCASCGAATERVRAEVLGCPKCPFRMTRLLEPQRADPGSCPRCNP